MAPAPVPVGSRQLYTCTFKRRGVLMDPTTVTLEIMGPAGESVEVVDGDLVHPGPGVYEYEGLVTSAGVWTWAWVGEGAVAAVSTGGFFAV